MIRRWIGSAPGGGGGGAVDSVNGETGVVALVAADIPFTPGGTIAATDVQGAIAEAAAEGGGGVPDAHAPSHEAGGADPITNLGIGFAVKDGADEVLTVTDDSGTALLALIDVANNNEIRARGDTIQLFNYSAGSHVQLSSYLFLAEDDAGNDRVTFDWPNGLYDFKDAANVTRIHFADDGTGVTLYDANAFARVLIPDDTSVGIQLKDAAGVLSAVLSDGALGVYAAGASGGVTAHGLLLATDGVTADETLSLANITGGTGVLLRTADDGAGDERNMLYIYDMANSPQFVFAWRSVGGGGPLSAVFGATPYGQDAYLAPLNESVSITLLTDVAALLDEERARINAINSYLIARGWELAA